MKKTLKNKQKNCISNHNGNIEGEKISMKLIFFKIVSPTNQHAWHSMHGFVQYISCGFVGNLPPPRPVPKRD